MEVRKMLDYVMLLIAIGAGTIALSIYYLRKAGFDIFSIHKRGH